jgi:hypothetical protein
LVVHCRLAGKDLYYFVILSFFGFLSKLIPGFAACILVASLMVFGDFAEKI